MQLIAATTLKVPASAHDGERLAANALTRYLTRVYPEDSFPLMQSAKGRRIPVGTLNNHRL